MKYYVTADVHSYFSELKLALSQCGFFEDPEPHKLIICGDLYDRGLESLELQQFILDLMEKDQIILIKGNHEDLAERLLNQWHRGSYFDPVHSANHTIDTVCQLTQCSYSQLSNEPDHVGRLFLRDPFIQRIIPAMLDYFETDHYIFVHGWIPCEVVDTACGEKVYQPIPQWRDGTTEMWKKARWINGMEAAHKGIREKGKTIVCGHWHCSFGHCYYLDDGGEFDNDPNFGPYCNDDDGIIALDAATPTSHKVNCIVLED